MRILSRLAIIFVASAGLTGGITSPIYAIEIPKPVINIPKPTIPRPTINVPRPNVTVNVPKPVVNVPKPVVNVPKPVVNVPKVDVPKAAVNVPKVDVPKPVVNVPKVDVPKPAIAVVAPKVDVPKPVVAAPKVDVPRTTLPQPVSVPKPTTPSVQVTAPAMPTPAVTSPAVQPNIQIANPPKTVGPVASPPNVLSGMQRAGAEINSPKSVGPVLPPANPLLGNTITGGPDAPKIVSPVVAPTIVSSTPDGNSPKVGGAISPQAVGTPQTIQTSTGATKLPVLAPGTTSGPASTQTASQLGTASELNNTAKSGVSIGSSKPAAASLTSGSSTSSSSPGTLKLQTTQDSNNAPSPATNAIVEGSNSGSSNTNFKTQSGGGTAFNDGKYCQTHNCGSGNVSGTSGSTSQTSQPLTQNQQTGLPSAPATSQTNCTASSPCHLPPDFKIAGSCPSGGCPYYYDNQKIVYLAPGNSMSAAPPGAAVAGRTAIPAQNAVPIPSPPRIQVPTQATSGAASTFATSLGVSPASPNQWASDRLPNFSPTNNAGLLGDVSNVVSTGLGLGVTAVAIAGLGVAGLAMAGVIAPITIAGVTISALGGGGFAALGLGGAVTAASGVAAIQALNGNLSGAWSTIMGGAAIATGGAFGVIGGAAAWAGAAIAGTGSGLVTSGAISLK